MSLKWDDPPSPSGSFGVSGVKGEWNHHPGDDPPSPSNQSRESTTGTAGNLVLVRDRWNRLALKRYDYVPLSSPRAIRLLRFCDPSLRGVDSGASFAIQLHEFSLDDCPEFEALSYTWGSPFYSASNRSNEEVKVFEVECNECSCDITENLLNALECLRPSTGPSHYLWVDALCINQSDDEEKGHQVGLMGDIYRAASRVVVWLGPSDQHVPDFEIFRVEIQEAERSFQETPQLFGNKPLTQQNPLDAGFTSRFWGDSEGFLKAWTQYFNFFRTRRYFRRAWIVQEVALARDLVFVCGSNKISWEDVHAVDSFIRRTGWRHALASFAIQQPSIQGIGDETHNLFEYRRLLSGPSLDEAAVGLQTLFRNIDGVQTDTQRWYSFTNYMVQEGRRFTCSDSRDQIYAFLGLANQFRPPDTKKLDAALTPNYTDDHIDIFTRFTAVLVNTIPRLSILSLVEDRFPEDTRLPSWVPDFSVPVGRIPLIHVVNGEIFDAFPGVSDTKSRKTVQYDNGWFRQKHLALQLSGVYVRKLKNVSSFSRLGGSWPDMIQCLEMAIEARCVGITETSPVEILWRTLIADVNQTKPRSHPAPPTTYGPYFATWFTAMLSRSIIAAGNVEETLKRVQDLVATLTVGEPGWDSLRQFGKQSHLLAESEVSSLESTQDYYLYNRSASDASRGGRVLLTSNGFLGFGRQSIREGDEVWLLKGARVPFVMRRIRDSNEFTLMGEAYVHGIMHGEWVEREDIKVETVIIK